MKMPLTAKCRPWDTARARPLAKCYLKKEGDETNFCLLFENILLIRHRSKDHRFSPELIQHLTFQKRIFLMPVVFGGLAASLASVGLFQYTLYPWWLMPAILFLSIIAIYYGLHGSMAMTVVTPVKEYDFFIDPVSDNLRAFAAYTLRIIKGAPVRFYVRLPADAPGRAKAAGQIVPGAQGLPVYASLPVAREGEIVLELDTENAPFEIKYITGDNGELQPRVFGHIPIRYVNAIPLPLSS